VKKILVLVAASAAGFFAWQKIQAGRSEQTLWAETTDKVH
jgi:hypothetical protein